jgi:hypothetical protein
LQLIRLNVQPALMARTSGKMTPFALMALLQKLASPFNLMRLPEELRLQIYRSALHPEYRFLGASKARSDPLPALLYASSQIRQVALPVYYEQAKFFVDICSLKDAQEIQRWAANIAGPSLRFMRKMTVSVPWKSRHKVGGRSEYDPSERYVFDWSPEQGLQMTDSPVFDRSTRQAFANTIKATNAYAKATDRRGEAIILAISAMTETWKTLHFQSHRTQ